LFADLLQRGPLGARRSDHWLDGELAAALLDQVGAPAGEDRHLDAGMELEEAEPVPVAHVERLEGLAFLSVEESAVGERAVDVEHDQPDAAQQLARRLPGSRRHAQGFYQNRKEALPDP